MVKIEEIASQNPWWRLGQEFTLHDPQLTKTSPIFFQRKEIELKKRNIYLLRGPRQVGKTTYIKETINKLIEKGIPPKYIFFISLDQMTSRREFRKALNYFFDQTREASEIFIFLDEMTSLEDWNLELKILADQGITQRGSILATGSSPLILKEKGERLPGRGLEGNEYFMKPLSFREFLINSTHTLYKYFPKDEFGESLGKLKSILESAFISLPFDAMGIKREVEKVAPFKRELAYLFRLYLSTGGLPMVINHYLDNRFRKPEREERIDSPLAEVYIRDILGDFSRMQKQEAIGRQILKSIVNRYGSKYSFSNLSREIEVSHNTIIAYLEFLEESFISFVHYAYDFNRKNVKVKGEKKVYFFDPFIYHSVKSFLNGKEVWGVISESLLSEEIQSQLVEGMVISHLLLSNEIPLMRTGRTFLWNYYDQSGREIDGIFESDSKYLGIEVKYQSQVDERDLRKINSVNQYLLLTKDELGGKRDTLVIPVDLFLALLQPSERNL
jgi:predicted AAA+ superfamily ATPase